MEEKKPEGKVRAGTVSATVWKNVSVTKDGKPFENFSVTVAKNYKDKDDKWQTTNSFNLHEMQDLLLVVGETIKKLRLKND